MTIINHTCQKLHVLSIAIVSAGSPCRDNPPEKPAGAEVEFSRKRRVLHEEVEIFGQPDHRGVEAGRRWAAGAGVCRELGISSATFYKWRAKYGGMAAVSGYSM